MFKSKKTYDPAKTLIEFMEWLHRSPLAKSTVRDYEFIHRDINRYIECNGIQCITSLLSKRVVVHYLSLLSVSESRKNHHRAFFAKLCEYLDIQGIFDKRDDPVRGAFVKIPYDETRYFVPNALEFQMFLQGLGHIENLYGISGRFWTLIFQVVAHTGLRNSEFSRISFFRHIHKSTAGYALEIPRNKEKQPRTMLISDRCAGWIRELSQNTRTVRTNGPTRQSVEIPILPFVNAAGDPVLVRTAEPRRFAIAYARRHLSVTNPELNSFPEGKEFRLHDCRRYLVDNWMDNMGATVIDVQRRLGHKNITTTMRYTNTAKKLAREAKILGIK